MNSYGTVTHYAPLIVTRNRYLQIGIEAFVSELKGTRLHSACNNAIFIDVESLAFVSDPGVILKNAVDKHRPVIFVCSSGKMSMFFRGKFPHLDCSDSLRNWRNQIGPLLSPNLPFYYLKEFNEFLFLKKLGVTRLKIITLINQGYPFDVIARKLCLPPKSLYRYINGLVSYFDVKNASCLFYLLRDRFPPGFFDPRVKRFAQQKPKLSTEKLPLFA